MNLQNVVVFGTLVLGTVLPRSEAALITYADRTTFLSAVGASITDDYSTYTPTPSSPTALSNIAMSSVLGETRYESLSFTDFNLVGDVYVFGDGTNYCAGCNGNFQLSFDSTSLSVNGGVFAVGLDIVLHTSRRTSIGDVVPGERVVDGTIIAEFTDGTTSSITVPADIGFFGPEIHFVGLSDNRGIKSLTVGTDQGALRHFWVIDNLTVATVGQVVPEPSSLATFGILCLGLFAYRRFYKSTSE